LLLELKIICGIGVRADKLSFHAEKLSFVANPD
jgi:hypothetical protein